MTATETTPEVAFPELDRLSKYDEFQIWLSHDPNGPAALVALQTEGVIELTDELQEGIVRFAADRGGWDCHTSRAEIKVAAGEKWDANRFREAVGPHLTKVELD